MNKYQCRVRSRTQADLLNTVTVEARDFDEVIGKLHRDGYVLISADVLSASGAKHKVPFGGEFEEATPKVVELP
ncbi:MAG: hypothetical protein HY585_04830, partial [Candidatus Omnitrophica bacterium]|nr:hypothetical protein [Candidatus Omnitrophota bacterium]